MRGDLARCAALGVNGTVGEGGEGDHQEFGTRHSSGVYNTFYFVRTHEAVLRAADALGKPAAETAAVAARLAAAKSGMNFVYYDRERGRFVRATEILPLLIFVCDRTDSSLLKPNYYRLTSHLSPLSPLTSSQADPAVKRNETRYGAEPLQTACSLGLASGSALLPHLVELNATAAVRSSLLEDVIETQGGRLTTGLIGTKYFLLHRVLQAMQLHCPAINIDQSGLTRPCCGVYCSMLAHQIPAADAVRDPWRSRGGEQASASHLHL